jgi:large subunit ribosomal protein L30
MSEETSTPKKRKGVDELLTEVASAAKVSPAQVAKAAAAPKREDARPAEPAAPAPAKFIKVRQIRSGICTPVNHKKSLQALGLRKIRQEVTILDTPSARGLMLKIRHLIEVVTD